MSWGCGLRCLWGSWCRLCPWQDLLSLLHMGQQCPAELGWARPHWSSALIQPPEPIPQKAWFLFLFSLFWLNHWILFPLDVTKPPGTCKSFCRRMRNGNTPPLVWYLGLARSLSFFLLRPLFPSKFFKNTSVLLGRTNSYCWAYGITFPFLSASRTHCHFLSYFLL